MSQIRNLNRKGKFQRKQIRDGEELGGKKWLEASLTFYRTVDTMVLNSEVKSPVRS